MGKRVIPALFGKHCPGRDFQRIAERSQAAGALGQALLNVSPYLCCVSVIWPVRFQHPRFWNGWTCAGNEWIERLEEGAAMTGKGCGEQARTARCQRILKLETALWRKKPGRWSRLTRLLNVRSNRW